MNVVQALSLEELSPAFIAWAFCLVLSVPVLLWEIYMNTTRQKSNMNEMEANDKVEPNTSTEAEVTYIE